MGLSKTEIFAERENLIASFAKAFGHPARVAILQYLINQQSCVCGDIVNEIGLAQATVSQHLKELKNIGLITGSIEGASVCYCIDSTKWNEMKSVFTGFLSQDISCKDSCC